jgi:hypothetical protein
MIVDRTELAQQFIRASDALSFSSRHEAVGKPFIKEVNLSPHGNNIEGNYLVANHW